jgi:hypothetical protein
MSSNLSAEDVHFVNTFLKMDLGLFKELLYTDIPSVVDEAYALLSDVERSTTMKSMLLARTRQINNKIRAVLDGEDVRGGRASRQVYSSFRSMPYDSSRRWGYSTSWGDSNGYDTFDVFKMIERGDHERLKTAIMNGANVNEPNANGDYPLHIACWKCSIEMVSLLVVDGSADRSQPNAKGQLPLHLACKYGAVEVVRLLLHDMNYDVNTADVNGVYPLHNAAESGSVEIVNMLLEKGAFRHFLDHKFKESPAGWARFKKHFEVEQILS